MDSTASGKSRSSRFRAGGACRKCFGELCSCWYPSKRRSGGQAEEYELGPMSREGRPTSEGFGKYAVDPNKTFFADTAASPATVYQPIRPVSSVHSSSVAGRHLSSHLPTSQTHLAPLTATRSLPTTVGAHSDLGAIGRQARPRLQHRGPFDPRNVVYQVPLQTATQTPDRFHIGPTPSVSTNTGSENPTLPPSAPCIKSTTNNRDSVTVPGHPPLAR